MNFRTTNSSNVSALEWLVMGGVSGVMLVLSIFRLWSLSLTEVLGFVTGGICVWLVVKEHIWNWPVGLANNVFFFVLFYSTRLYADMALQVVYLGLGIYGWWHWLYGGVNHKELAISRTPIREWIALAVAIPLATIGFREILLWLAGAAPFWDSLSTVLSLAAQYLLTRKRLENWFFWILADLIYIPLYFSRSLPLTAVLYGVFLIMCFIGLAQWLASWRRRKLVAL